MWYATCVVCAAILAWGLAYCGKNIAIGLSMLANAMRENSKKK